MLFNCENCGCMFNGRKQYDVAGRVVCPSCGFLVYQEPYVNVRKKERIRKGFAPHPQMDIREWKRKQRLAEYEKKWKEEEKKKEERA